MNRETNNNIDSSAAKPRPEKRFNLFNNRMKRAKVRQQDITDCGAACLASVLGWYGLRYPISRIRQLASTDQKGTSILGLVEAAEKLNLSAKAISCDPEAIKMVPLPAIAHVQLQNGLHHYVVVFKADDKNVRLMDPFTGNIEDVRYQDFQSIWSGILLLLAPLPDFEPGDLKGSAMSRLLLILKPHRAIWIQVLIGAMFYTLLGLTTSIYLQKIIDNIIPDANQNLLNIMSLVMIGILLVQLFINYVRTLLTVQTGQQIDAQLILGYYKHLLRLPQQFFDNMRTGEIISRMNDAVKIRTFVNEALVSIAVNVFILVFAFALMFTSYWKLALIMLIVIPFYSVIYFISDRINKKTQRKLMEDNADLGAQLVESVNAVGTIKQFSIENYANIKTENKFVKLLGSIYQSSKNSLWIGTSTGFISGLFVVILLWTGTTFVLNRSLTPGELLSFYALMGYFTEPVLSLIGINKVLQDAMIAFDRLFEIMDLEKENDNNKIELVRGNEGNIEFRNVSFRYGSRAEIFTNLNMTIESGKVTAIIGESGSGKTTLLALLQNLYPLSGGHVMIGEYDLRYVSNPSLRSFISVVPQKVDLFAGTVRENIAVGSFNPDIRKLIDVCKSIGILDMIEELPNGFDTMLGENGVNLSGGQRQRLAIARALYRDPEILIMDEATSSLDSLSEQKIHNAIQAMQAAGKTVIIIAHRLSTIMSADKIMVLHKGALVEEGRHDELLKKKEHYFNLWERQFPGFRNNPIQGADAESAEVQAETKATTKPKRPKSTTATR